MWFSNWLSPRKSLTSLPSRSARRSKAPIIRLWLEPLEDRTLLSTGWAVSNAGTGTLSPLPANSTPDSSGDFYVTGYFTGTATFGTTTLNSSTGSANPWSTYVSKVDPNGNYLWATQLGGTGGNTGWDGIALDSSGDLYVTGNFGGTAAFGSTTLTSAGGVDIYICKLDSSSGNVLWAQRAGGANDDWGMKVAVDDGGNLYLSTLYSTGGNNASATFGTTTLAAATGSGSGSLALSKLDANTGNWLWSERLSSTTGQVGGLTVDASGNVYMGGVTIGSTNSYFLAKYDPNGQALWTDNNLGTNGNLNAGFALATYQDPVTGGISVYDAGNGGNIQKVDASSGAVLWSEALGAPNYINTIGRAVAVDASGNVYIAGQFSVGPANFDPGSGSAYLTSEGSYDAFVVKLDSLGKFLSAWRSGGTRNDGAFGLTLDSSGNMYTAGSYQGTADFDTGSQTVSLTSPGSTSLFLAKTTQDTGVIFGRVFNDLNNNGVLDAGSLESGLPNVTVYLDLNNSGSYVAGDPTAITDSQGYYHITDVAPGSYTVRQIVPSGYTATPALLSVSVSAGLASETTNFADYTPNKTRTYSNSSAVRTSKGKPNAVSSLNVSDSYTVLGMTLALNVSNNNHNNLTIYLTGANGTRINLGSTTQSGALSFQVSYFDYTAVKGTWTLEVDGLAGGTLNNWSLNIDGTLS